MPDGLMRNSKKKLNSKELSEPELYPEFCIRINLNSTFNVNKFSMWKYNGTKKIQSNHTLDLESKMKELEYEIKILPGNIMILLIKIGDH
jgi:hypothetical protein